MCNGSRSASALAVKITDEYRELSMTSEEFLRRDLLTVEANDNSTEAVMLFHDNSRLCFCHRVDERWAKAVGPDNREEDAGFAGELLSAMTMFRLNAKHLDIQFEDGVSRRLNPATNRRIKTSQLE